MQRTGATHRQLRQGSIREYNIWRNVFLAGDCRPQGLEVGQEALFVVPEHQVLCLGELAGCGARLSSWLRWSPPRCDAEAVVATPAVRSRPWVAKVAQDEGSPALLGIRVALDGLELGELRRPAPVQRFPVDRELWEWRASLAQVESGPEPFPDQELLLLEGLEQRRAGSRPAQTRRQAI